MGKRNGGSHTGSCLCGAVAFEVNEFSSGIFKCHCSKCRKAFGGASSAAALAPQDAFEWVRGEDLVREFQESPGFKRRFCPTCGSILPQLLPDYGMYWIPAGLFDNDPGISLTKHIHVASKASWEVLDTHTPQLEQDFDL
jgi:hypothetical protein